jgi:thioredoxin reductase (NADPH)
VVEIRERSVRIATPDGEKELKNDFVFAMTGYRPDTEFLEAHGIRFDPNTHRPNTHPETLESDRKGMFLAGVLVAGMHTNEIFIENGRFHGKIIAEAIAAQLISS